MIFEKGTGDVNMGFILKFGIVGVLIVVALVIFVVRSIVKKAFKLVGFILLGIIALGALSYLGLMNFITGM